MSADTSMLQWWFGRTSTKSNQAQVWQEWSSLHLDDDPMWRHWKGHLQGSIESLIGPHSPEPSQIPIRPNFGRRTLHSPQKLAQPVKLREDIIWKAIIAAEDDKSILKRGEYSLEYLHHLPPINREVVGHRGWLGTNGPAHLFEGLSIVNVDAFSIEIRIRLVSRA